MALVNREDEYTEGIIYRRADRFKRKPPVVKQQQFAVC